MKLNIEIAGTIMNQEAWEAHSALYEGEIKAAVNRAVSRVLPLGMELSSLTHPMVEEVEGVSLISSETKKIGAVFR